MNLNLNKEQQLILLGVITSIIIGLGVTTYKYLFAQPANVIKIDKGAALNGLPAITVHICGAVGREGVYKLKPGDRLLAAIDLAGGARPTADLSALNLAEAVKDGQKIDIPFRRTGEPPLPTGLEKTAQPKGKPVKANAGERLININTATEKDFDSLPGVGPSTAKAIVEYRKTKGPFRRLEQIMEIPRLGKSKFEKLKSRIIV